MTLTATLRTFDYKGAGHRRPRERRDYTGSDELRECFEKWLGKVPGYIRDLKLKDSFEATCECMDGLQLDVDSLHGLVDAYSDRHSINLAGLFLSAGYHRVTEDVIVCDFGIPLSYLGHCLPEDKVLWNKGKAGFGLGAKGKGVVVNCGHVEDHMGYEASGVVVNLVRAGDYFGSGAFGVVVNFGETSNGIGNTAPGVVVDFVKKIKSSDRVFTNKRLLRDGCFVPVIPNVNAYCKDLGRRLEMIRDVDDGELPALLSQLPKAEDIKKDLTTSE